MKFARFTYGTFGFLAVGSLAWGCSTKTNDCDANKTCGPFGASGASGDSGSPNSSGGKSGSESGGEGGASGEGGDSANGGNAGSGGAACVPTASPDTAPCVIGDSFGLFVSLSGNDATGDGTEAHPLATVTQALTLTGPGKINRIYVCATPNGNTTSYDEPDTLTIPDRISIYGGFTCDGGAWKYVTGTQAYIKPESAIGATITSAMNGVTLQDVRIDAQNAPEDGTGASSFGMIVNMSNNVVLTRVEIHAGKGASGPAGSDGVAGMDGTASGVDQLGKKASCVNPPNSQDGGKSILPVCTSQGGAGGKGVVATTFDASQSGESGFPKTSTNGGLGGMNPNDAGTVGQPGSKGTLGTVGAAAASAGTLSPTGFAAANGGDGTSGTPGQGGGGGGASLGSAACVGASGGAGGMGGCGGNPGKGGVGGGASIGLLSWNSDITMIGGALVAVAAGAGGNGGAGGPGGSGKNGGDGGTGDPGHNIGDAGVGGKGGPGGNGGNGSGGTGGPSIALAFTGAKPAMQGAPALSHAMTAALGGVGGQLGAQANWGTNGSDGLTADQHEQP